MLGKFDDTDLALGSDPADAQPTVLEAAVVVGVDAVVAVVVLGGLGGAVQPCRQRAGAEDDRVGLAHERARQGRDHEAVSFRARLSVIGVSDPENVARELDDRVLEATSGADQWYASLARVADGLKRAVHAPIRAGGRDPEPAIGAERAFRAVSDGVGRPPLKRQPEVTESRVGEGVGRVGRVEVADDADQGRTCRHGSFTTIASPLSTRHRAPGPMTAVDSRSSMIAGPSNVAPGRSAYRS